MSLAVIALLLGIATIQVNAKVVKADLFTFNSQIVLPSGESVVGKVVFGKASSAEQSKVDWMVTVDLEGAAPNREYLVYVEKDYWSDVYVSIGFMSSNSSGYGSFHYNGRYATEVSDILAITGPGTYVLSIALNDVTGITITKPVGATASYGISVYLSAASATSWTGSQVAFS